MTKSNVVLTGMSGAGKSTIGVLIARSLGLSFVDTDLLIQKQEGKLLQKVLDDNGVDRFLEIEEKVLAETGRTYHNTVIATGGSAVYSDVAMTSLKTDGIVVYLDVPCANILARLRSTDNRGIVLRHGNTFEDAYEERVPLYCRYSDLTIDCSHGDIQSAAEAVLKGLKEMGFAHQA